MKILVTGGAGFIGSHIIDYLLARGDEVVCVDNFSLGKKENLNDALKNKHFHLHNFNLLELDKLREVFNDGEFDIVYHLAANSDIQAGCYNVEIDLRNTFLTTFNILSCMRTYGVNEIIFASSSAIYGDLDQRLSEHIGPLFPISNYGAAKLSSEAYISAFCENYTMKAWIIRFPNVVGWRLTHGVIYDLLNRLENDQTELLVLGNGKQQKPYLYIDDLISGLVSILFSFIVKSIDSFRLISRLLTIVSRFCENKEDNNKENVLKIASNNSFLDFLSIIPLQLLAYKLSLERGLNPDMPRNLAKVVTVE